MSTVHCLRCGYNLSGLDHGARCPECSLPVARSLAGDLLRYAEPGYLGSLRVGLMLLACTAGAQVALTLASCTASVLPPLTGANLWNPTTLVVWAALWTVLVLTEVGASFLLARSDPGQLSESQASGLRVSLMIAAGFLAVLQVAAAVFGQWAGAPPVLQTVTGVGAQLVHVVFMILLVRYLMWIARRVPSEPLAASLMAVLVFALVAAGLGLISQVAVQVAIRFGNPSGGFWRAYPWFTTPITLMRAGVMVWSAVLFVRLAREVARQAALGRAEQPQSPPG
ncbi:MAG: hypothetical protein DYG92_05735 [Leptolyngbya sp. PLA1]|nr:hypothetical protein [Leptolyngbya sp. PLA1]